MLLLVGLLLVQCVFDFIDHRPAYNTQSSLELALEGLANFSHDDRLELLGTTTANSSQHHPHGYPVQPVQFWQPPSVVNTTGIY